MKKKMTTAEFIEKTEADIRREEIRAVLEDDPRRQREIRSKIAGKKKLLSRLKEFFTAGVEYR